MAVTRSGNFEKNMQRFNYAIPFALTAAGAVVIARTRRIFIVFRPRGWATGATVRSLTVSPAYRRGGWWRVNVGPTTKYAFYVEFGRRAGRPPPVSAILDWVREKHIAGTYAVVIGKRGPRYKRTGSKGQRGAEDLAAAFAIARSIGLKGTKPFPALRVGFRQSKNDAIRVFSRTLASALAKQTIGR